MKKERDKKIKLIAVICGIVMILFGATGLSTIRNAQAAVTGTITASTLFVRTGPSTEYEKATVNGKAVYLSRGDKVAVSYGNNGWYYVTASFEGTRVNGFVSAAYVAVAGAVPTAAPVSSTPSPKPTNTPTPTTAAVPTMATTTEVLTSGFPRNGQITATSLNVRKDAGTTYDSIASLPKGTTVSIVNVKKSSGGDYWYEISFTTGGATKKGYVHSKYVAVALPTSTPTPSAAPTSAEANYSSGLVTEGFPRNGMVTASRLNVRTGTGTNYEALAVLVKTTKVTVLAAKKAEDGSYWYQISFSQDGVTRKGYVHSNYISIEQSGASATPTAKVTPSATPATPSAAPSVSATPTPVITVEGERITKEEVQDADAIYYFSGVVTAYQLNLRESASSTSNRVAVINQNTQVLILNQTVNGSSIWYKVALKSDGKVVYGYMLSKYVRLMFTESVSAQIIWEKVRVRNQASQIGAYIKEASGAILTLEVGENLTIIGETTVEGAKWFEIRVTRDNLSYSGFVPEEMVLLQAAEINVPTPTPSAIPTPSMAPTPTAQPSTTPKPTMSPTPTLSPTPTVSPTPTAFPTPRELEVSAEDYPVDRPGIITGYGTVRNDRIMVAYQIPILPFPLIYDEANNPILLYGTETLTLYEKYRESGSVFWHVSFVYEGKTYYGYLLVEDIMYGATGSDPIGGNTTNNDVDFETYLTQQGFPETYKPYLRILHEKYPTWVFEAYHTGLQWDTVMAEESIAGKNLIPNSKGIAWKSLETGAYNWSNDTFILYDGSTWVTASQKAIAYYMDPRNFLNETNIFMFEVLRYAPTYQNEAGVESILNSTPFYYTSYNFIDKFGLPNTSTYARTFIAAAEYSGVSPYHLATRVKQEVVTSSSSVSNSVSGTVSGLEGLYNFYNIGAYHSTVAGGAIANALKYAKNGASNNDELNDASLIPWTNPYDAIVGGAYILGSTYINRGQDTIYLQKFNVTDNSTYYHQYMANVEAPMSESKKTASAYTNLSELPIVFSIPVYYNMPQEKCPQPGVEYNPNNWLKSLEIFDVDGNELQLTPSFNQKEDQTYYLVVDEDDVILQIEAEAVSKSATVYGSGFVGLDYGSNVITVSVIAENGDLREYVIIVAR